MQWQPMGPGMVGLGMMGPGLGGPGQQMGAQQMGGAGGAQPWGPQQPGMAAGGGEDGQLLHANSSSSSALNGPQTTGQPLLQPQSAVEAHIQQLQQGLGGCPQAAGAAGQWQQHGMMPSHMQPQPMPSLDQIKSQPLPLGLTLKRSTSFLQLVESSDGSATTLDTAVGGAPHIAYPTCRPACQPMPAHLPTHLPAPWPTHMPALVA